ncbi:MAG: NAD(P)-dependent oxidoreductase [Oceanospirillaceae bacterium]|nr:NAD(P)-dependent oxidoreductase [Oceanospirillaceae bacterium]
MDKIKHIIIFGGSGFIGTHLINQLVNKNIKIISADIKDPEKKHKSVEYIYADVRDLSKLKIRSNIDTIYNFAAIHTTPGHEDIEYFSTNVFGALEVTKFASKESIKEIIFTSSIAVYGSSEEEKNEASNLLPTSAYGVSKTQAEGIHKQWFDTNAGAKLIIVRPSVVFGKGEGGNYSRLARILDKGFFIYPGRKDTIKGCIYIKELLASIDFAQRNNERIVVFNAVFPKKYSIEDIVECFKRNYFHKVKSFMVPIKLVIYAARLLSVFDQFHLGINQERVLKLVKSTNIEPKWLVDHGYKFSYELDTSIRDWYIDTGKKFN